MTVASQNNQKVDNSERVRGFASRAPISPRQASHLAVRQSAGGAAQQRRPPCSGALSPGSFASAVLGPWWPCPRRVPRSGRLAGPFSSALAGAVPVRHPLTQKNTARDGCGRRLAQVNGRARYGVRVPGGGPAVVPARARCTGKAGSEHRRHVRRRVRRGRPEPRHRPTPRAAPRRAAADGPHLRTDPRHPPRTSDYLYRLARFSLPAIDARRGTAPARALLTGRLAAQPSTVSGASSADGRKEDCSAFLSSPPSMAEIFAAVVI
jgi:hypothetical protein